MKELHLTKRDFKIEWYSGSGAGGQHRNKHQNCCRITHLETGLRAQATESRERPRNQDRAFRRLVALLLAHYAAEEVGGRRDTSEVIRNYHGVRNDVHDKASGEHRLYRDVLNGDAFGDLVDARRKAMLMEDV